MPSATPTAHPTQVPPRQVWTGLSRDHRHQTVTLLVQLAMHYVMAHDEWAGRLNAQEHADAPRTHPHQNPVVSLN